MTDSAATLLQQFYQFLRYCIDDSQPVPASIGQMDWEGLFVFCEEQAILGIGYRGLEPLSRPLPEGERRLKLPKVLLFTWYAAYEQIAARNKELNRKAAEICRRFDEDGFECCLLKGQGNAAMYSDPLARTPGDIDVWIKLKDYKIEKLKNRKRKRKAVTDYVRQRHEVTGLRYHHVEYEEEGVPVEVHFTPCTMNNPFYDRRLQRWFREEFRTEKRRLADVGEVEVPTAESNVVYQLAHMMHHFFDEGLGLRQVMDYYILLHDSQSMAHQWRDELEYLNLYHFAGAVMYVLREVFGMEEQHMIVPVDEWRGRTLLREIMEGGNFGRSEGRWKLSAGKGKKYFVKIWRNLHFVWQYPAEALCEPVFRTWHFFWRLAQTKL